MEDELAEMRFWAAYGQMKAGMSKSKACSKFGLSVFKWNDMSQIWMQHAEDDRLWYAVSIVKNYADKYLDSDISKLADVDFSAVFEDQEFGDCDEKLKNGVLKSKLMNAVLFMLYDGLWPQLNYDTIENNMFMADYVNVWTNYFDEVDGRFDRYSIFDVPKEVDERVQQFRKKFYTLGNIMILPQGLKALRRTKAFGRGYMEVFLDEFYKLMTRDKNCHYRIVDAMYLKSKELNLFRTKENFTGIVEGLMLESLLDQNGVPRVTTNNFSVFDGGCSLDVYVRELTSFLDFAERIIDERAERMISVVMAKVNGVE